MNRNRQFNFFLLLASLLLSSEGVGQNLGIAQSSDSLVQRGVKLYLDGRYRDAIDILESSRPDSGSPISMFYLGMSHAALNEFEDANRAFTSAIRKDSLNIVFRYQYGQLLSRAGAIDEAIRQLKVSTTLDSAFYPASSQLAQLCEFWQKESLAYRERLWAHVLELNPNDYLALYYQGLAMFRREQPDSGVSCLKKAMSMNSNFYLGVLELANRALANKSYDEAFDYYQQALKLRPDNAKLHHEVGEAYRKRNELQKSVFHLSRSTQLDTTNAVYVAQLGLAYFYMGKFDSAAVSFRRAIFLDKENYAHYLNLGLAYERMDSTELAIRALNAAIVVSDPGRTANLYERLASLFDKKKRYEEEKRAYGRALEIDPSNRTVLLSLGYLHERMHDQEGAIRQFKKYLEAIQGDSTMTHRKQDIEGRIRYWERTKGK